MFWILSIIVASLS